MQPYLQVLCAPDPAAAAAALPETARSQTEPTRSDAQNMLRERAIWMRTLTQTTNRTHPSIGYRGVELDVFIEVAADIVIGGTKIIDQVNFHCVHSNYKFQLFKEMDRANAWWMERVRQHMRACYQDGERSGAEGVRQAYAGWDRALQEKQQQAESWEKDYQAEMVILAEGRKAAVKKDQELQEREKKTDEVVQEMERREQVVLKKEWRLSRSRRVLRRMKRGLKKDQEDLDTSAKDLREKAKSVQQTEHRISLQRESLEREELEISEKRGAFKWIQEAWVRRTDVISKEAELETKKRQLEAQKANFNKERQVFGGRIAELEHRKQQLEAKFEEKMESLNARTYSFNEQKRQWEENKYFGGEMMKCQQRMLDAREKALGSREGAFEERKRSWEKQKKEEEARLEAEQLDCASRQVRMDAGETTRPRVQGRQPTPGIPFARGEMTVDLRVGRTQSRHERREARRSESPLTPLPPACPSSSSGRPNSIALFASRGSNSQGLHSDGSTSQGSNSQASTSQASTSQGSTSQGSNLEVSNAQGLTSVGTDWSSMWAPSYSLW
jgi:hypothetical protein